MRPGSRCSRLLYVALVGPLLAAGTGAATGDAHVPSAFAMRRSRQASTVFATTGPCCSCSSHMSSRAYELVHGQHRDLLVMTLASFLASIAATVVRLALFLGAGRERDGGQPAFLVVMLVSVVAYLLSFVLMLALSRHPESVAEPGAAVMTGRPGALVSAVTKIAGALSRVPDRDLRVAAGMKALSIVPARVQGSPRGIVSTHPPMERRIAALQRIDAALQGAPARTA